MPFERSTNSVMMGKGKTAADIDVAVPEAAASTATDEKILRAETVWKIKLGTRVHGLNAN